MAQGSDPDRRKFLKVATGAVGGGIGLVVAAPALRLGCDPAGRTTVTSPKAPIDIGPLDSLAVSPMPRRVEVRAPLVADGWSAARDVVLGAVWVRRPAKDHVEALSAVCPHLGCAVGLDPAKQCYVCPCHNREFELDGTNRKTGTEERGMDSLPIQVVGGRLQLTWIRYKNGGATKVPV